MENPGGNMSFNTTDEGWQQTVAAISYSGIATLPPERRRRILSNVEKLPYYHYRLHRTDVEAMIRDDGDFILRKGTRNDPDGFTVSVRWNGRMLHFPIHWVNGLCCFEGGTYTLIQNLIHHYHENVEPVTQKSQAILKKGRSRLAWELLEEQLDQFVKIGKGAFGSVFSGKWTRPDGQKLNCAIKTLDNVSMTAEDGQVLDRARNEVLLETRIMRELSGHPNLVKTYGYTIDREVPFVVMELMDGGSLEKRLRIEPHLPIKTKLRILVEIARGLSYINRSGYIHRDIAARNILFELLPDKNVGIVKITDFGMARKLEDTLGFLQDDPEANLPVVWAAMEAVLEAKWYLKSDVWSMGVIIWEVFADGSKPYCELITLDKVTISKHLEAGYRLRAAENMSMPEGVERLMEECMLTSVHMRPPMSNICWRLEDEFVTSLSR